MNDPAPAAGGERPRRTISVVVPCYNEIESIGAFHGRVTAVASSLPGDDWEFCYVDDGSHDGTGAHLDALAAADPRVTVLHLAHNRGHQIALTAGIDHARGDVLVTIDADLQDPPEFIRDLVQRIDGGADVVHAQRRTRAGETVFKLATARLFYWIMRRLSGVALVENCGDFRAFTRPVAQAVRAFRTPHRFLRGLFVAVGFRQAVIQYDRDARHAGTTKYPLRKMLRLAVDALLSFSTAPLRFIIGVSITLWGVSVAYLLRALYERFALGITEPGWTSLVALLFFFTGLILFSMAVIGAYVGRIFVESQRQPLYWLRDARNLDAAAAVQRTPGTREVELSREILQP